MTAWVDGSFSVRKELLLAMRTRFGSVSEIRALLVMLSFFDLCKPVSALLLNYAITTTKTTTTEKQSKVVSKAKWSVPRRKQAFGAKADTLQFCSHLATELLRANRWVSAKLAKSSWNSQVEFPRAVAFSQRAKILSFVRFFAACCQHC